MEPNVSDFYDILRCQGRENLYLLELREHCLRLEASLYELQEVLPPAHQAVLCSYLDIREEMELQLIKEALQWGKHFYK